MQQTDSYNAPSTETDSENKCIFLFISFPQEKNMRVTEGRQGKGDVKNLSQRQRLYAMVKPENTHFRIRKRQ